MKVCGYDLRLQVDGAPMAGDGGRRGAGVAGWSQERVWGTLTRIAETEDAGQWQVSMARRRPIPIRTVCRASWGLEGTLLA
jgi:hypothetical protein